MSLINVLMYTNKVYTTCIWNCVENIGFKKQHEFKKKYWQWKIFLWWYCWQHIILICYYQLLCVQKDKI